MCIDKSYFFKARELFNEYGYTELNTQYDDCLAFLLESQMRLLLKKNQQ